MPRDDLDPAVLVLEDAAAAPEQRPRAVGAREHRRLGEHLGVERRRRDGGDRDEAGPRRLARRGVDEVVGEAAVRPPPQPRRDARGRDAARADSQPLHRLAGARAVHRDLPWLVGRGAADGEVAAAGDREADARSGR